ncbi:zinc-dependent alcohol dehydrogenase [Rhizobium skierniewicense]|uniref:zinc-dependent alcohol dehydrogenase n=1 Tax=Rhizobium skierniewicense TaxID=984260 RepID=UPI0015747268|nr:zinc-binding alcohol dehydrogenase [Rhizobium skierniewicense]NTF34380.1 zinc-binding alcohol dehydrogenase [Rhizobium skierniewicense]
MREEILRAAAPHEVLVRTLYSGISRGTESLVLDGRVPQSEFERMRGPHMGGDFPFPVKYGYSCVGLVEMGPPELLGKKVFCLHPHQDVFITTPDMVSPLPERLSPERAVLAANMETALNIVWDALIQPGDRVAVFGGGVVGTLVASLSNKIAGTETVLVDVDPDRRAHVEAMGIRFIEARNLDGEFDVLINASASAAALSDAIQHAGMEARIVEASWYGEKSVTVPLGGAFHSRRLSFISSQVGSIPAFRKARWTFGRRMAKALDLLLDHQLDHLISGETAFTDLADEYPRILSSKHTLCHRIRYP